MPSLRLLPAFARKKRRQSSAEGLKAEPVFTLAYIG
jgi:hypothetical protein